MKVRDILVMYIKNQKLENEVDRSCLLIPPSDGIHSILASYSSANKNKQTTSNNSKAEVNNAATSKDDNKGSAGSSEDRDFDGCAGANDAYDDGEYIDPLDDNYTGPMHTSHNSTGGLFGNIPLPGSSGAEIKMKVHQGGLKSIDHSSPLSTTSSYTPTPSQTDYPALGSTTTKSSTTSNTSTKLGVGGWGVDKGTTWKPVTLSTARANTTLTSSTSTPNTHSKSKSSMDTEFPTLGSSTRHTSISKKNTSSGSKSVVYSELPTDLNMKKEDVFKAVMKKMSPYFAVISQTGEFFPHLSLSSVFFFDYILSPDSPMAKQSSHQILFMECVC